MDQAFVKVSMASAVPHLQEINDSLSKEGADPQHLLNHLGAVHAAVKDVVSHIASDARSKGSQVVSTVEHDAKAIDTKVSTVVHTVSPMVWVVGVLIALAVVGLVLHRAGVF